MNKKDLFNAIDNIDEKFINDAGKYLKNVNPLRDEEPEELEPQKKMFSPIRLIAPIAASTAVIVGIAIALKTINFGIKQSPETNMVNAAQGTSSSENSDIILDSAAAPSTSAKPTDKDVTSDGLPATKTEQVTQTGDLPFTLYGPDYIELKYDDIAWFTRPGTDAAEIGGEQLNTENWESLHCEFAYIADPLGNNFNDYITPEKFVASNEEINAFFNEGSSSRRISKGDMYNDLVVSQASCNLNNIWVSNEEEDNGLEMPQALNSNYLSFDGKIVTNGYIVKSEGETPIYKFFFADGEIQLPLINYANRFGEYNRAPERESLNGFSYIGELPAVRISSEYEAELAPYFVDTNVQAASVQLSNISMLYSADSAEGFQIWADTSIVEINGAPYGGSEYNGTFQSVIDKASTTSELSYILWEKMELMKVEKDLAYFRVFRIGGNGSRQRLEEVTGDDTPLEKGMVVYFYDSNGNVFSHYEYIGEYTESANQGMPDHPVE